MSDPQFSTGQQACFNWIHCAVVRLVEFEPHMLGRAEKLMLKYKDTPMDFADATLVVLAETFDISRVFTLYRTGFTAFRYDRRKKFEIAPK